MACCRCPTQAQCLYPHATCEEACGLTGTSPGGASAPTADTAQGAMMQGFLNGFMQGFSNPTPAQPARQMTPEEVEAQRQAQIAQQKAYEEQQKIARERAEEEARKERERIAALDQEAQNALALVSHPTTTQHSVTDEELMSSAKPDPTKTEGYSKGFKAASQCFSQSAGTSCSGSTAEAQQGCVADYNAGYSAGSRQREMSLQEAFQAGKAAGANGGLANGASDARATGDCRVQWIEKYNQGYFQGKQEHSHR